MALAKAEGSLSFRVLPDEIRKRFNGTLIHNGPDVNDKWIYKKHQVTHTSANIFATTDEFLGIISSAALVLTDNVRFIMIKNLGFSDTNQLLGTSNGVMIVFTAGAPAFDSDDDEDTPIFLAPGDTIALKVPVSEADDWHARSCTISGGIPSANGSSGDNVMIEIAAIIDDGS